jgi:hypothetical protein
MLTIVWFISLFTIYLFYQTLKAVQYSIECEVTERPFIFKENKSEVRQCFKQGNRESGRASRNLNFSLLKFEILYIHCEVMKLADL